MSTTRSIPVSAQSTRYIDLLPAGRPTSLPDPDSRPGEEYTRLFFYVRINTLKELNIPKDNNPRDQNIVLKVPRLISQSAQDKKNRYFHLRNRGLLLIAHSIKMFENGVMRLFMPETGDKDFGIADGATTYETLLEDLKHLETMDVVGEKLITVEVLASLDLDEVHDIVAARNTSNQVNRPSLIDHDGGFDFIKQALYGTDYSEKIIYRQNAKGAIFVRDVITALTTLNLDVKPLKPDVAMHGPNIYGNGDNIFTVFENNTATYNKFRKILPELLELHDYIGANLARLYIQGYSNVRPGQLKTIFDDKTPYGSDKTPFTGQSANRSAGCVPVFPHKAVWLACLGAFRCMIVEKDGAFGWDGTLKDMKARFDLVGHKMAAKTRRLLDDLPGASDANDLGRGWTLWESMYELLLKTA